jgi:hypothetical protein
MRAAASLPLSTLRTASTTCAPLAASAAAVSKPRPVLEPVTTAMRPVWSGMSVVVHLLITVSYNRLNGADAPFGYNYTERAPRFLIPEVM